ncbi:hypothetical protein [Faecalibacillus intestinalis]|uniref:hypothetical protein n=1 Tax=Faecalibacillus intestinalis TaxID=1982626 RepID=UPI003990671B
MKLVKKIIIYIIVIGLMFGFVLGMLSINLKKVYALEKEEKITLEDDTIKDSDSFSISKVYDTKIERECPTDKLVENVSRETEQVEQEPTQEDIAENTEPIEIWIPEEPEDNIVELTPLEQIAAGGSMEEKIKIACNIYGADYDITLAIGRYETGWWKSYACTVKNNPGGMSRNEVPIYYDTIDEGIDAWVQNLANNYFAMGLDTPEKIAEKYCPNNSEYASYLRKMMSYGG